MSETYTPTGGIGTAIIRATVAEAATGTFGNDFMRTDMTTLADKARFLGDDGLYAPKGLLDLSDAAAGQIKFPAAQNASANANTLDDYEEGTWTPVIAGSGTAGTYELAASSSHIYRKIGDVVIVAARIVLAGAITGGGVGNLQISGLPFAMSATHYGSIGPTQLKGIAFTGSYVIAIRGTSAATSTIILLGCDNTGAEVEVPIGGVTANDEIRLSLIYTI